MALTSRDTWRLRAGVEAAAMFFASLTSRRLDVYASLRSGCVDFFTSLIGSCLDTDTNVTRGTRGENIFNNKIYIGDSASNEDV